MYIGICREQGIVITDDNAFRYALERITQGKPEEQQEFTEWFYSNDLYMGICQERGIVVDDSNAFRYALEHITLGTPVEQQEFIEWFYSGNWVKEEDNGPN